MTAPTYADQPPHIIGALEQLDDDAQLDELDPQPADSEPAPRRGGSPADWSSCSSRASCRHYTVRVANRETIAYEKTLARHKEWPSRDGGQHLRDDVHGVGRGQARRA
jgi:hypothetical protein